MTYVINSYATFYKLIKTPPSFRRWWSFI